MISLCDRPTYLWIAFKAFRMFLCLSGPSDRVVADLELTLFRLVPRSFFFIIFFLFVYLFAVYSFIH